MLSVLSPRQKQAIEMMMQGMTRREVAAALNVKTSYVKNLWQGARRRIRENSDEAHQQIAGPRKIRPVQLSALAGATI